MSMTRQERKARLAAYVARRAAQEAIDYAPEKSWGMFVDWLHNNITDVGERNRLVFLLDHIGKHVVDLRELRVTLAKSPPFEPIRPLSAHRLAGKAISETLQHAADAQLHRKALARYLSSLIQDKPWLDYERITGRRCGFPTLRDMLVAEKAWQGADADSLREILSSFEQGRAALAGYEAELKKGEATAGGGAA